MKVTAIESFVLKVPTTKPIALEFTEHGLVDLKGKSLRERALCIIDLADPKFRDGLLREATELRLV